jgi:hypothetical protein
MNTKKRIKKLLTLVIVVMALLSLSGTAQAVLTDVFSLNFYSDFQPFNGPDAWGGKIDFATLDEYGVDQVAGYDMWNKDGWLDVLVPWDMPDPIVPVTITSKLGETATFTFDNARNGWTLGDPVETGVGNDEMMNASGWGTEDDGDGTLSDPWDLQIFDITVADIPFPVYDVICYFGAQEGQWIDGTAKFVLNGAEQDIVVLNGYYDGTFTEIVDSVEAGNFILFEGLTDPTLTIQIWGTGFQHVGLCGLQIGVSDPNAPSVDVGPDMATWKDEPVIIDANVVNNDQDVPQRDISLFWTAELQGLDFDEPNLPYDANDIVVVFGPNDVETTTVTVSILDPNVPRPVIVKMTLAATLQGMPPVSDSMKIKVYDDTCAAALGAGAVIKPGDFDADCDTDLIDLRKMINAWLDDYTMTESISKP